MEPLLRIRDKLTESDLGGKYLYHTSIDLFSNCFVFIKRPTRNTDMEGIEKPQ